MAEDGGLDLAGLDFEAAVAGPVRVGKQFLAHGGEHLPVGVQPVDVADGDAAFEVGFVSCKSSASVLSI